MLLKKEDLNLVKLGLERLKKVPMPASEVRNQMVSQHLLGMLAAAKPGKIFEYLISQAASVGISSDGVNWIQACLDYDKDTIADISWLLKTFGKEAGILSAMITRAVKFNDMKFMRIAVSVDMIRAMVIAMKPLFSQILKDEISDEMRTFLDGLTKD